MQVLFSLPSPTLQNQLLGNNIEDVGGLADYIIAQESLTTIVKSEEDVQAIEDQQKANKTSSAAKKAKRDTTLAAATAESAAPATIAPGELTEEGLAEVRLGQCLLIIFECSIFLQDARYNSYAVATSINLTSYRRGKA